MKEEIIISGFGGQGVLSMGKIIAYAGLMEGKEVSWMPSYGPEQRGGTANVTVIISDHRIASPILCRYDTAIVLNQPSLERFEPLVKPGGTLIYDPYSIMSETKRTDINVYCIHAMEEAARMQNAQLFNMFLLGGLLKVRNLATTDDVISGLRKVLPPRHHNLIKQNEEAIIRGMELIYRKYVFPHPSHIGSKIPSKASTQPLGGIFFLS